MNRINNVSDVLDALLKSGIRKPDYFYEYKYNPSFNTEGDPSNFVYIIDSYDKIKLRCFSGKCELIEEVLDEVIFSSSKYFYSIDDLFIYLKNNYPTLFKKDS